MTRRFASTLIGLDLSGRSPYSKRSMIGLPPAIFTPPVVRFVNGQPSVKGVLIARVSKPAQDYLINPPSPVEQPPIIPSSNPGNYGNSGQFSVTLAAGIPQLVLKRPAKTRVQLTVQNLNLIGILAYNFDGAPSIATSINVGAGGNRVWDTAVPQGDMWLISNAVVIAVIEFINKDLQDPNT